ncbi:MAG: HAD family hydrolase [Treponema sp.]|jgi:phosphoglycolate phosphatase/putative hydrolase of the HAD superfamily|nr:HAD family hydrolase [Treponema sp.]
MKVFSLPETVSALLFDMDCTLYTHGEYARSQTELPVRRLAEKKGKSFAEMTGIVQRLKDQWETGHGGRKAGLGAIFESLGISVRESAAWRAELYEPERYLAPDPALRRSLKALSFRYALAVVTNNPLSIAERTLACLSVRDLFGVVVGLDTCLVSKPDKAPFLRAAELLGVSPSLCVSIGDRYDIDIAVPLELGMGGVLVDGVEDVRSLLGPLFLPPD